VCGARRKIQATHVGDLDLGFDGRRTLVVGATWPAREALFAEHEGEGY
jgi:hypothetical protein